MEIIKPRISFEEIDPDYIMRKLETSGRKCYQSTPGDKPDSAQNFIKRIISRGHTSVIEHVQLTFDVICDRGVSHELVRHRISSYSQESTRYVKYNNNMQFIKPIEMIDDPVLYSEWIQACEATEASYKRMIEFGAKAGTGRSVLNNSLKTEIRCSMNLRALRNFFTSRCEKGAHEHMREIAIPALLYLRELLPVVFEDIEYDQTFYDKYLSDDRWREYVFTFKI